MTTDNDFEDDDEYLHHDYEDDADAILVDSDESYESEGSAVVSKRGAKPARAAGAKKAKTGRGASARASATRASAKSQAAKGGGSSSGGSSSIHEGAGGGATPSRVSVADLAKIPASVRNSTRDYSFKQRFTLNYGHNEHYYQHCLKYKASWEDKMFYVSEEQVAADYARSPSSIRVLANPDNSSGVFSRVPLPRTKKVAAADIPRLFGSGAAAAAAAHSSLHINVQQAGADVHSASLAFGESVPLGSTAINRNALAWNAGGHITAMKWLPNNPGSAAAAGAAPAPAAAAKYHYLATSFVRHAAADGSVADTINDPTLGLFSTAATTPASHGSASSPLAGGIQIWRFDLERNEVSLYKAYITTPAVGITSDISWLPAYQTATTLGVLAGSFSDGKVHLIRVEKHGAQGADVAELSGSSLSYQIHGEKITCYDFLGHDKIIAGLSNGAIAEFILPLVPAANTPQAATTTTGAESDISVPSFVQAITEAPITGISVGSRELDTQGPYTVLINSAGAQCFAVEYPHFQHGRMESWATNSLIRPLYNRNLKIFLSDDSQDSLTYSFIRHPSEKATFVMKVDGTITAISQSEILGHPLNLNGNSVGEVHVINVARKVLNGSKATNKVLQPLRLWKFSKEGADGAVVVSADLVPSAAEKPTKLSIAPPEVGVSALAWNESIEGSSVYAAATVAGLLVVERLDPAYATS